MLYIWNPYPNPPSNFTNDENFGRAAAIDYGNLYKRSEEDDDSYLKRLTFLVSAHLVHFWPRENINYVGAHPLHNFPLWCQVIKNSCHRNNADYGQEFWTPRNGWIRGYGLCSQASKIVFAILQAQGFSPTYLSNSEHVVVGVGNKVINADYGVIIPYNTEAIQKNAAIVKESYNKFPDQLKHLQAIYRIGFDKINPEQAKHLLYQEIKMYVLH